MTPAVLIVDDSLTVRMGLSEAFEEAGLRATPCASIAGARRALRDGPCDLVVLDVQLPDGDGVDLLCELREAPATAGLPVMLLSLRAEVQDRLRGLRHGADEYVGKPYDIGYVIGRACELIQRRQAPAERRAPVVLVIDDSATSQQELREGLEALGHGVLLAGSGEEGLRQAVRARPDLIVVDGVLPGIDGAEVVRRLRADLVLGRTPCLLLTAAEGRDEELRALEAGADAYVRKAEGLGVVRARVTALLRDREAQAGPAEPGASLLATKRILIVDDSPAFLRELSERLGRGAYELVTAGSADEALALLKLQPVDCILLDVVLPGISGQELCRRIKAAPQWRDIPLLLLTGQGDMTGTLEGLDCGADDYIIKSGDFEVLGARLHAQLRRKTFADADRRARRRLERELRERDAFLGLVAHELRTPLTSLKLLTQGLLRRSRSGAPEPVSSPAVLERLERLDEQVERYSQLVCQLLTASQLTVGPPRLELQALDLVALLAEVLERFRAVPGRQVTLEAPRPIVGRWDRERLAEIVASLVSNALKYSGEQPVEVAAGQEEGRAWFTVRDHGIGMNAEEQARVFGRFERAVSDSNYGGLGLGLWIARQLTEALGGEITVRSRPGQGTTFRVELPLTP